MTTSKQLFTHISSEGQLSISLNEVEVAQPKPHQVVVRIEAAPINPSDMWPMFGPANLAEAKLNDDKAQLTAPVHERLLQSVRTRLDQTLPIGNEGAGIVVAAGDSPEAQALLGKTVGVLSGAMYAEYICVPVQACIAHNEGVTPKQAASSFVNPLTALSMVENMRLEGHKAIVHTAAASSLGQMLQRICNDEDIPLINIVRNKEQEDILKAIGAKYICNSSDENFRADLYKAIDETGATLCFDAIGGGEIASHVLTAMELSGTKEITGFNTYGSEANKQVYVYGGLDMSPTTLNRAYGMTWSVSGWLLNRFLARLEPKRVGELYQKIANEINTTFTSTYTDEISLADVMDPATILKYNAKKTGSKFLVNPTK
ncbi:zinc-binding dehydrogenase [Oceaniserpentilla sp. 4NH20-0058]|uniref:zinc-binding dehydrogenase n=1 Tax=Oceaniserpentilla sp. 4NH20-0058 TaxID=3127660 RepID=UPI00310BAFDD